MRSGTPREIEEVRRGGRLALAVAGSVDLSGEFAERGPTGKPSRQDGGGRQGDGGTGGEREDASGRASGCTQMDVTRRRTQAAGQAAARKWI